jgi:hypothetical protein
MVGVEVDDDRDLALDVVGRQNLIRYSPGH